MENSALASSSSSRSRKFNPEIHPDFSKATSRFMQSYSLINPEQSSRKPWWFTAGQSHVQFRFKIVHLTGQAPSSGVALRRCLPVRKAFPHPWEGSRRVQTWSFRTRTEIASSSQQRLSRFFTEKSARSHRFLSKGSSHLPAPRL